MDLSNDFERKAREALVEEIQHQVIDGPDNLTHQFVQAVHENLREYGERYDYNVEPVIDALQEPEVTRHANGVTVRLEWDHVFAHFAETGTSDHTIEGDPILSFVWERRHDPPQWVRETFEREGKGWRVFLREVEVSGIPEGRPVRDALNYLRLRLTGQFSSEAV